MTHNLFFQNIEFILNNSIWILEKIFPFYNFLTVSQFNSYVAPFLNFKKPFFKNDFNFLILYENQIFDIFFVKFAIKSINFFLNKLLEFLCFFEHFDVQVQCSIPPGTVQIKIFVDRVTITLRNLPLEFYLPLFKYSSDNYLIE